MTEGGAIFGSSNYLWSTDDRLSAGSMGYVYVGIHRRTEMKYAVKVFHKKLKDEQKYYIQNEMDTLARIPAHYNIITIIDSEIENYTGKKVIIMELCEMGSLREILNKTENYFGLREDEFLLVFKHIGNALCHLHENGIIHRNITPGNILCGVLPNGSHVYKIGNFAKSKLLNGEEESLRMVCDSEEYMHPDIHRDIFLGDTSMGTYDWGVDLWSFGVTLYKCATGRFPFMPYRGIKGNRRTMQRLTNQKEPGVISQVEMSDGSISYSKCLPRYSYLTSCTKDKVEHFLAMLFDLSTRIKPTDVYKQIHDFQEQNKIYIFDIQSCSMFTPYLHGTAMWHDVKKQITRWTAVPYDDQLLFWNMNSLDDHPDLITKPISIWLKTTEDKPLLMISLTDRSMMSNSRDGYYHSEDYLAQTCHEGAKETCGLMYLIEEKIKNNFLSQQQTMSALMMLRSISENRSKLLKMKSTCIEGEMDCLEVLMEMLNPRILHSTLPEFESLKTLLRPIRKSLLGEPDFNPNIVLCRESKCFQKSQKMIKDCETLYHEINALQDEASVLEMIRCELCRISQRVGNLYRHHCCKTTNDLIQICAEPIRRYVSLIQAERKLDSDNIKLKELEMSLSMVNISQY